MSSRTTSEWLEQLRAAEQLRPKVEKALGRQIGHRDWQDVIADNDVIHDGELWVEDVAAQLRRRFELRDALPGSPAREKELEPVIADQRFDAAGEILALEAGEDPGIERWRSEHLGGQVVAAGELDRVIGELRRREPKTVEAVVLTEQPGPSTERQIVEGELLEVRRRSFRYLRPDGAIASFSVATTGPLGQLAAIADRFALGYHWSAPEVATFVLTGQAPRFRPIVVRLQVTDRAATSRITIEADPRTSRSQLAKAFDEARKDQLLAELAGVGSSRPLNERTVTLALFLARHQDESWRAMLERWNAEHPDWLFADERAFWKDARVAWRRVVGAEFSKDERARRRGDLAASDLLGIPPNTLPFEGAKEEER